MTIRVLLADDHALVRDGLQLILEDVEGIEVVGETGSGREAVALAQSLHPDVVILDIAMPDLNGIDAAEAIRQASPETHVLIVSMHATSEHVYRALRAGASGYVVKESAGAEVVEAVKAVAAGRRFLSATITDTLVDLLTHERPSEAPRNGLERLSVRERQILPLVVEGKSSAEIGMQLSLSSKTVDTYRARLMAKLGVKNLACLVKLAVELGVGGSS